MLGIVDFLCWVAVVALSVAFILGLAAKWRWLEWAQVHAPNDIISELLRCKFCCSFWVSVLLSVVLSVATGYWALLFVPVCSSVIARELW